MATTDSLELDLLPDEEIVMPWESLSESIDESVDNESTEDNLDSSELISPSILGAITTETVKTVLLGEESRIIQPNYVLDFTDLPTMDEIQTKAIDSLLKEDGDTALYVYMAGSLDRLGMGYKDELDRILLPAVTHIFNGQCKIYRDYDENKEVKVVRSKDLGSLSLTI